MSWDRFIFLLDRLPRILSILKELWAIIIGGPEDEIDDYLSNLAESFADLRAAKNIQEKKQAATRIADIIHRL